MEFGLQTFAMSIMKSIKRETIEGTKLRNQEKIRMFGEKKPYMYLGIMKAGYIKEINKLRNENLSKPNLAVEISSKEKTLGHFIC